MIVTCENCEAKFSLDDDLIKESGSKVQCSKCQHVFIAYRQASVEESDLSIELEETPEVMPDTGAADEDSIELDLSRAEEDISLEELGLEEVSTGEKAPEPDISPAEEDLELKLDEGKEAGAEEETSLDDISIEEETPVADQELAMKETPAAEEPPIEEDLDLKLDETKEAGAEEEISLDDISIEEEIPAAEEEISLDDISIEEETPVADQELAMEETPAAEEPPIEEDLDLDLAMEATTEEVSGLDESGLVEESLEAEAAVAEQELAEEGLEAVAEALAEVEPEERIADESLELEVEEARPPEEIEEGPAPHAVAASAAAAKRRISAPIAIAAALVIVAGAAFAAFSFLKGSGIRVPFIESLTGQEEEAAVDSGNLRITLLEKQIGGRFVSNNTTGPLFVVTGSLRNDYTEPRNFIMVKGVLYSTDGRPVQRKTVYCGTLLPDNDLQTLDKAGIEKRLANRSGDNRSNVGVPPASILPFQIVFSDLPQDMAEYSIEVVSSAQG